MVGTRPIELPSRRRGSRAARSCSLQRRSFTSPCACAGASSTRSIWSMPFGSRPLFDSRDRRTSLRRLGHRRQDLRTNRWRPLLAQPEGQLALLSRRVLAAVIGVLPSLAVFGAFPAFAGRFRLL